MEKKKKLIYGGVAVLLIILLLITVWLLTNKKNSKVLRENTYTMYVKINPLVKLTFKETYFECIDNNNQKQICSTIEDKVLDYDMLNDDAKEFYKDIDFNGKSLSLSLAELCDIARDHDIGFENLAITTDYEGLDTEQLKKEIQEDSKYEYNFNLFVDFKEVLKEEEVIEELEKPLVLFNITFDTTGGTEVEDVLVRENGLLRNPVTPSKNGYEFVEWQLDGEKYDFNTKVTKNINLQAVWKKVENENDEETKTVELNMYCGDIRKANVEDGLIAYCDDTSFDFTVTATGPKSFVESMKYYELRKLVVLKADFNGKAKGKYSLNVQVASTNKNLSIEPPKTKMKFTVAKEPKSTLRDINLNDNILVGYSGMGVPCGSTYVFSDNISTVLANFKNGNTYMRPIGEPERGLYDTDKEYKEAKKEYDQRVKEWNEAIKKVTYNKETAKKAHDEIEAIFKNTYGLKKYSVNSNPEAFSIGYANLALIYPERLGNFGKEFNGYYSNLYNQVEEVLKKYDMADIQYGGCGGGDDDVFLLTEKLCKEYHLTCHR